MHPTCAEHGIIDPTGITSLGASVLQPAMSNANLTIEINKLFITILLYAENIKHLGISLTNNS